jgi:hypothetical protein
MVSTNQRLAARRYHIESHDLSKWTNHGRCVDGHKTRKWYPQQARQDHKIAAGSKAAIRARLLRWRPGNSLCRATTVRADVESAGLTCSTATSVTTP